MLEKAERVWTSGCFDMVHYGHANFLRQAKTLCKTLVVCIHSDEKILMHKGPPVFTEQERCTLLKGIKWVDEIVEGAPNPTLAVLDKYNCDFCVHGEDLTCLMPDGVAICNEALMAGKYVECKRTADISTTDVVRRILLLFNDNCKVNNLTKHRNAATPWTDACNRKLIDEFSSGKKPKPGDKIVYASGAFDLFHVGHLAFLEAARALGDYLIVGIFDDDTVKSYKGEKRPVMSLNERALTVLAYKPVDQVVIGAPYNVNEEFIKKFNISIVAGGSRAPLREIDGRDPFEAPKRRGIFQLVDSKSNMRSDVIIKRILDQKEEFEQRNKRKCQTSGNGI